MRYHVKGGIWKNTEDEILKAAVMKYGLNQWSRISSLLVRKSAKQCKERWYEWLDPNIKKTEWLKDEEEKLLHLAKMFPCQWRTIAPFVGRTAYQCLEHYEKLLDKAQGRISDENDPRKLRQGEIDPNPEVKPARPDPIDADEDTKETLNEARARVANTRGKKAKRKIREKQLEEARRLAALQKKRELKSAGIEIVLRLPKKKKKEMNYNADVPFMRHVPKGTWSDALEETPEPNKFKGGISLQYLENRNRDIEEEKNRKIDERRMKNIKQKQLPVAIEMINKLNDPLNEISRNKLNLPEPQITEIDLKEISKLTSTSNNKLIENNPSTNVLTGDYSLLRESAMSTLRTPKVENKILTEAKLAVSILEGQTPLIGGENSKGDLDFYLSNRNNNDKGDEFKTPFPVQRHLNQTPFVNNNNINNTTISSINTGGSNTANNANQTMTPFKDEMKINNEESLWESIQSNNIGNTGNKDNKSSSSFALNKESNNSSKNTISNLFKSLPQPKNKYEIDMTNQDDAALDQELEIDQDNDNNNNDNNRDVIMKDAEDINKERLEQMKIEQQKEESQYSEVIRNKLPRPHLNRTVIDLYTSQSNVSIDKESEPNDAFKQMAYEMITEEAIRLIKKDNNAFPFKGMMIIDDDDLDTDDNNTLSQEDKELIEEIISEEALKINKDQLLVNLLQNKHIEDNEVIYQNKEKGYTRLNPQLKQDKFIKIESDFKSRNSLLAKETSMNKKLKAKAEILTHGYQLKYSKIKEEMNEVINDIIQLKTKKVLYNQMYREEQMSFLQRKRGKEELLSHLLQYESELQNKYKAKQSRANQTEQRVIN